MTVNAQWRRLLGNLFLVVGLLLILGAILSMAWPQIQGDMLRARLRSLPPDRAPSAMIDATASPTALAGNPILPVTPSPTPTMTPNPTPTATGTAETTDHRLYRGIQFSPVATAAPTPTATATQAPSPTASPTLSPTTTLTPSPTPIPPVEPVRIVIPDLGINVKVTKMTWQSVPAPGGGTQTEWQIPKYSAGHAVDSALLGQPGNMVISGHNNIYGRVFMAISEAWGGQVDKVDKVTERSHLLDGRLVEIYGADGRRVDYQVTDFLRVQDSGVPLSQRLANGQYIAPGGDTRVTITTCWPPWSNTHRLILIAKPVN
jgi:sortase (surface protein transpeptidase)